MKLHSFLFLLCALPLAALAQMPAHGELSDTKPCDGRDVWLSQAPKPTLRWGSTDVRYSKCLIPTDGLLPRGPIALEAWRGERANAQAVLYTSRALEAVTLGCSDLRSRAGHVIPATNVRLSFVRYVLTDEANRDGLTACGARPDKTQWDSTLVADALDPAPQLDIEAQTTRPVWVQVDVPRTAQPGLYSGTLTVQARGEQPLTLPYTVSVSSRELPAPAQWQFHLDLWQNPYAVARFYGVRLWSDDHFRLMRPTMELLASAGQKVITASVMTHPWGGQTEDAFESMVLRTLTIDGAWQYDYTVFDRWVEFMMSCGVDAQINCYTMIPWVLRFNYFDQATATQRWIEAEPGTEAYNAFWLPFLKDFARHLREKGWFEKTAIAIDERSLPHMREAFRLVKEADKDFMISAQVKYYPEVEPLIHDLCLAFADSLPETVKARRDRQGQRTTFYTCCAEAYPNTFTFSEPAEATWLPWHAAATGLNGYLRWAYNSWTLDPLRDTRFRTWAAGDCFLVYPGASSIRMEKLIEGIQDAEKVRLLREEFERAGNGAAMKRLNDILNTFTRANLTRTNATETVEAARKALGELSKMKN